MTLPDRSFCVSCHRFIIETLRCTVKILIVEDDLMSREMMSAILEPYGTCHMAANGAEGLDAFRTALDQNRPYDLICLDLVMPGMTGHEVIKTIRGVEEERNILPPECAKVIIVSAMRDCDNIMGAFINQCEAYLVKPVATNDILKQLHSFGLVV